MREIREDARNAENKQIVKAVEIMLRSFVFIPKAMWGGNAKGLVKSLWLLFGGQIWRGQDKDTGQQPIVKLGV